MAKQQTVKMVVSQGRSFSYQGRRLNAGDEFEVPDVDTDRWALFGLAQRAETPLPQPPQPRKGRKAEPDPGSYNRSDLRADK